MSSTFLCELQRLVVSAHFTNRNTEAQTTSLMGIPAARVPSPYSKVQANKTGTFMPTPLPLLQELGALPLPHPFLMYGPKAWVSNSSARYGTREYSQSTSSQGTYGLLEEMWQTHRK